MKFVLLAAAASLLALPAYAWTPSPINQAGGVNSASSPAADSGSAAGAAASSSARSAARSASVSAATGGRATANGGAGGTGGSSSAVVNNNGGGGGSGGGAQSFSPPSLFTANTCAAGISIGGFGVGGGGGGAAQWELHDCRLRTEAAMLDARGDHAAARNVWCQISEVHKAYEQAGDPCPDGNAKVQPVNATTVVVHKDEVPDWCFTTSAKDPTADRFKCQRDLSAAMNHLKEIN